MPDTEASDGGRHPSETPDAEAAMSAIPGVLLLPDSPRDAKTWDENVLSLRQKLDIIAWGHRLATQEEQRENRRTGLHRTYSETAPSRRLSLPFRSCDKFLHGFKGAPSARRASRPQP